MGKKKLNCEIREMEDGRKLLLYPDHRPTTRRQFIAQGFVGLSATAMIPSVLGMLQSQTALGAALNCPADTGGGGFKYLVIDGAGGPSWTSNWCFGGIGGPADFLPSYSQIGAAVPGATGALDNRFTNSNSANSGGLPMFANNSVSGQSRVLQGILNPLSGGGAINPAALAGTRMGGMVYPSAADSSTNPLSPMILLSRAGLRGQFVGNGTGDSGTGTGHNSTAPALDAAFKPLQINGVSDFVNALSFGQALNALPTASKVALAKAALNLSAVQAQRLAGMSQSDQFSNMVGCGFQKNQQFTQPVANLVDPRQVTDCQTVYGITAGSGATSSQVQEATIVYNLLKGNSGPGALTFGGGDYHTGNRTTGDAYDLTIGQTIGRALEMAFRLNVGLIIDVIQDGSTNTDAAGNHQSDANQGTRILIVFKPGSPVQVVGSGQLGYFNSAQGAVANTFLGNIGSPASTYVAFYNWLALNGREGEFRNYVTTADLPMVPGKTDDQAFRLFA